MSTTPPLKALFKRELLVAPKKCYALAGYPSLHAGIADDLRDEVKLTRSVPNLSDIGTIVDFDQPNKVQSTDPLTQVEVPTEDSFKGYMRGDLFSFYQRIKPAVVVALIDITTLTSGATAHRLTLEAVKTLHATCKAQAVRIVLAIVCEAKPEAVVLEEFSSIVMRDLSIEGRLIVPISTTPSAQNKEALLKAIIFQAERAYATWQSAAYRKTQALASQEASLKDFVRHTIKMAHFLELTQSWQSARAKFGEAYRLLMRAMSPAQAAADPNNLRPLCMVADWINLKLMLYAIGSGTVGAENMRNLLAQWMSHIRVFGAPLSTAHVALQSWHCEWVLRQHHVMLAILKMYCSSVPSEQLAPQLQSFMLLEGAVAAASQRQHLASVVQAWEFGVVLDTASVSEAPWLGMWVQKLGEQSQYLTSAEALAFMAFESKDTDHPAILAALLQDCLDHLPHTSPPSSPSAPVPPRDSVRGRFLVLIAQRGEQLMRGVQHSRSSGTEVVLQEAWSLLGAAAVQFRRDGWYSLLARALEYMSMCARLRCFTTAQCICTLELAVVGRHLPLASRAALARSALEQCLSPPADPSQPPSLSFDVQWQNMSSSRLDDTSGEHRLEDHGWLNTINMAVSCTHSGRAPDDVVVAVALRNMLPENSSADLSIPLEQIELTCISDLGSCVLPAALAPKRTDNAPRLSSSSDTMAERLLQSRVSGSFGASSPDVIAEMDRLHEHKVDWLPDAAAGELPRPDASSPELYTALQPGTWSVYAFRVLAGNAAHVAVDSVRLRLSANCSVNFQLSQLYDVVRAGGTVPQLICGSPTHDLSASMVGREAPFGYMLTQMMPGVIGLSLKQSVLPAVRLVLSEPLGLLHVGQVSCVTITAVPLGVSFAERCMSIQTRAQSGEVLPCRLFVGETFQQAVEIQGNEVQMPVLAKGVAHVVNIWVLGEAPCEGDLEVGMEGWEASTMRRWHFQVLEPFVFETRFMTDAACAVLMHAEPSEPESSRSGEEGAAAQMLALPAHVPAGRRCVVSLLTSSVVPFPVALDAMELTGLPAGWTLHSWTCKPLSTAPQVMHKGDMYAAVFHLTSPSEPCTAPLGTLQLRCRRLDAAGPEGVQAATAHLPARLDADARQDSKPESVGSRDMGTFEFNHVLPDVVVCKELISATLQAPAHVAPSEQFSVSVDVKSDGADDLVTLRADLAVEGVSEVQGELRKTLSVRPPEMRQLVWSIVPPAHASVAAVRVSLVIEAGPEGARVTGSPQESEHFGSEQGQFCTYNLALEAGVAIGSKTVS